MLVYSFRMSLSLDSRVGCIFPPQCFSIWMSRGKVTFISVLYRARNSPRQTNPFPPNFSHTSLQDYFWTWVFDHLGGDNMASFSNQATKVELGNPTKFCESKPPSNSHVC